MIKVSSIVREPMRHSWQTCDAVAHATATDKSAKVYHEFIITPEAIHEIKTQLETSKSIDKIYKIELKNDAGKTHCIIEKTIYIARKN